MDRQLLYLMRNEIGLHKIGISSSPERRRNELRLASGLYVELIKTWQCANARYAESNLHDLFSVNRRHGEWFKFESCPIASINAHLEVIASPRSASNDPDLSGVPENAPPPSKQALIWLSENLDLWYNNPRYPGYFENLLASNQRLGWLRKYSFIDSFTEPFYLQYLVTIHREMFDELRASGKEIKELQQRRLIGNGLIDAYHHYNLNIIGF